MAGKPPQSSIAIDALAVKDIIVCGQIYGGAMKAVPRSCLFGHILAPRPSH